MVYDNRAARMAANILMAQCQDLGLTHVQPHADGSVQAQLQGRSYLFRWDVPTQAVVQVQDRLLVEVRA